MTATRSYPRLALLGLMILGFLAFDAAIPAIMDFASGSDLLDLFLVGCCIGQLNLIAAWAMLLAVFMWYALVIGNRLVPHNFLAAGDAAFLGALLLGGVLVAQIPLWLARIVFHWRLSLEESQSESDWRQYGMRHLLLGMLLFSLALAPMRLVLPPGNILEFEGPDLFGLAMLMVLMAVCNLLLTVPVVWGAFLSAERMMIMAVAWIFYSGFLTAIEYLIAVLFAGAPVDEPMVVFEFYALNLAQVVTVLLALLALRGLGFRLTRGSREGSLPPTQDAAP